MSALMSSTDEKFDRLMDVMMAQQASNPAPAQSAEQKSDVGAWFIIKVIGGILVSVITAGLIAGMFWVIQTVSETSQQVQHNEQQRVSDRQLDLQKMETIDSTLREVKVNTADRFTRRDFNNEIAPLRADINRALDLLDSRTNFMTETRERLTKLEKD